MGDNRYQSDDHLTFSQRHGYESLPEPMQLEELSDDLRREIWNATREFLESQASTKCLSDECILPRRQVDFSNVSWESC